MNVIILNGSPSANGNSREFSKYIAKGAEENGHKVDVLNVGSMRINGCLACEGCHMQNSKGCVQNDDMQKVYPYLEEADVIIFSSAVHYWGFTGQLQSLITRLYALKGMKPPKAKKYGLVLSSGSSGVYDGIISQYNDIVNYFHAQSIGIKTVFGEEGQKTKETLDSMYEFGKSI